MLRIGVIGYGYWGPNIVRNFNGIEGARIIAISDKNPLVLKKIASLYSDIRLTEDYREITGAADIDAVAVVTPVTTHYQLAKEALENGKHIFVEKPFTSNSTQAQELISIAQRRNLKIMVDHTFLFTGAVRKIRQLINEGELGELYYFDSIRVNLGLFQHDVNVIWDLAPHDFSIMRYLIDEKPVALSAWGQSHINGRQNIAYVIVHFGSSKIAHFSVNWLSPVKVRTTLLGGGKRMVVWNDVSADDKVKVYDKGVEVHNQQTMYDLLINYRSGDMWAPKLDQTEALKLECQHFVEAVTNNIAPLSSGYMGLEVVRMLEACDQSLANGGKLVDIKSDVTASTAEPLYRQAA